MGAVPQHHASWAAADQPVRWCDDDHRCVPGVRPDSGDDQQFGRSIRFHSLAGHASLSDGISVLQNGRGLGRGVGAVPDRLHIHADSVPTPARLCRMKRETLPRFAIGALLAILWGLPLIWMVLTSIKPEQQIITLPPKWFPDHLSDFTLANYANVLLIPRGVDLVHAFVNSVIVSVTGTALVVVIDVLAAYALSRLHFPGRDALSLVVVASLIVPHEILLIPNYITVWKLDWLNSLP